MGVCPEKAVFDAAIRNELGDEQQQALIDHLDNCLACQRRLESLAGADELIPRDQDANSSLDKTAKALTDSDLSDSAALAAVMQRMQEDRPPATELSQDDSLWMQLLEPNENPTVLGTFAEYEVLEKTGQGGMGIVLKARDVSLDRIVAIKLLHPELAISTTAKERFVREAKAAAAVNFEHVVTIHAVGEHRRQPYLVMEFVDGQTLQNRIQRDGQLPIADVLRIATQVAKALSAAHEQGLIHRDIKPANILLENGVERVKVTDFGLAKAVDDATLSRTGTFAGTPQYMAPEQAAESEIDHRADLFSLGSVMYAMCTGESAFDGTTIQVLRQVCDDEPRLVREVNPRVKEPLAAVIRKLMRKRPEKRFQSANEVAEELTRQLAATQSNTELQAPRLAPTARTLLFATVGALGLLSLVYQDQIREWSSLAATTQVSSEAQEKNASDTQSNGPPSSTRPVDGAFRIGESSYGSLSSAIEAAPVDGVIEIVGDGPFDVGVVQIGEKPLTIQAANGFRPLIRGTDGTGLALISKAALTLKGLDIDAHCERPRRFLTAANTAAVKCENGPFRMSGCKVFAGPGNGCLWLNGDDAKITDSFLYAPDVFSVCSRIRSSAELTIDNCVMVSHTCVALGHGDVALTDTTKLTLRNSTATGTYLLGYFREQRGQSGYLNNLPRDKSMIQANVERVLCDVDATVCCMLLPGMRMLRMEGKRIPIFSRHLAWTEDANFYSRPMRPAVCFNGTLERDMFADDEDHAKWFEFCGTRDFNSIEGSAEFASTDQRNVKSFSIQKLVPPMDEGNQVGANVERIDYRTSLR